MIKNKAERIYKAVLKYCKDNGYIKALKKSLSLSEGERFNQKKIDGVGLDVVDAVYCVYDKPRTDFFLNCINDTVKEGDVVIEAGVGTGILSVMSSIKGAKVYGIELNQRIFQLAKRIISSFSQKIIDKNSIKLIKTDATTYKPLEKADAIISENIFTGMFYEKQVQIMNNLSRFLKKDGVVIPSGLVMGVILVNVKFPYQPKKNELFNMVEYEDQLSLRNISESAIYETLDFSKRNKLLVNKKIALKIVKDGEINGILLWNTVPLPDGKVIGRSDTTFLNSDILFPSDKIKKVKKGDIVTLRMKYAFGSKPESAIFKII
jgi:predicted RNA methylase